MLFIGSCSWTALSKFEDTSLVLKSFSTNVMWLKENTRYPTACCSPKANAFDVIRDKSKVDCRLINPQRPYWNWKILHTYCPADEVYKLGTYTEQMTLKVWGLRRIFLGTNLPWCPWNFQCANLQTLLWLDIPLDGNQRISKFYQIETFPAEWKGSLPESAIFYNYNINIKYVYYVAVIVND